MNAPTKRPPRPRRAPRPKLGVYFGPPCLSCGYTVFVVPCSRKGCERWSICCPACEDSDLDACAASNSRCPYCRVQ